MKNQSVTYRKTSKTLSHKGRGEITFDNTFNTEGGNSMKDSILNGKRILALDNEPDVSIFGVLFFMAF